MSAAAETQPALEKVADSLQQAINQAFAAGNGQGKKIKNLLNGVWLGHALHPALTDVPVGCWLTGTALDLLSGANPDSPLAPGADAALGLGILGAVGAAATGATDWSDTYGAERRTGLVHALLNSGALTLNVVSWLLRRGGRRKTAVLLSTTAFGIANFSAYLGGELVFKLGTMVNRNAWTEGSGEWQAVLPSLEAGEGRLTKGRAGEVDLVLTRLDGQVYALDGTCSHAGGPLYEGQLEGDTVVCPWHGSRFCFKDGKVQDGPACYAAPVYETRERDGQVEVRRKAD